MKRGKDRKTVGWREWLALPALGIPAIKAKVDTGARTSALHAWYVEPFRERGVEMVRFGVHPLQKKRDPAVHCRWPVKDYRAVSDSGGHREMRYVIETEVRLGEISRTAEITLSKRCGMTFRMLLGRTALKGLLVVPDSSYLSSRAPRRGGRKGEPA